MVRNFLVSVRKRKLLWKKLAIAASALLVVLAVLLLLLYLRERPRNIVFADITQLGHDDALSVIREKSNSSTQALIDGRLCHTIGHGIPPGQSTGMEPRFVNIGNSRGIIYRVSDDWTQWYVFGKFRVLYHKNGEWHEYGIYENEHLKFVMPE